MATQRQAFEAPGPGQWALDTGHFPGPATRFTIELFPPPARDGFTQATARFGLLLDHIEWAFVEGWGYLSPRPVAPLREAGPLTREGWDALVGSSPELQARLETSAAVFPRKAWRDDLAVWDDELRPALVDGHRRLQAEGPEALADAALLDHLDRARESLRRAITVHHRYNVTPVLPVGELLALTRDWTGASANQVLGLLRGAGPLAVGAAEELAGLAAAIRADPGASEALESTGAAADVVASLRGRSGPVGRAASDYVCLVGHWSAGSGFDVDEPSLSELPELLLEAIRAAVAKPPGASDHEGGGGKEASDLAADLRRAVPAAERSRFDELVAESRLVHRMRDERALYCEVWANGLMRRGILAAGARLVDRGRLDQPAHLVEATYPEMRSLLEDGSGPSGDELAARARARAEADVAAVPPVLGQGLRPPVPTAWLPPGAGRTEAAFRTYLAAMSEGDETSGSGAAVRGTPASGGTYEGPARVVHGASGMERVRRGDVLVADATSPAYTLVLPLVGAIVTDRGGMLSHAAIVAREYGIPAIVGADDATRRIPDGARVRVDGGTGEATVLDAAGEGPAST
jgi:pyruvate,water dikinase